MPWPNRFRRLSSVRLSTRLQYLVLALFSDLQVLAVASGMYGNFDGGALLLAVFFGAVGLVAVSRMFAESTNSAPDSESARERS